MFWLRDTWLMVALLLGLCGSCTDINPVYRDGYLYGVVHMIEPVRAAQIEVWELDQDGNRVGIRPQFLTQADQDGNFSVYIPSTYPSNVEFGVGLPPLEFVVEYAQVREYWSDYQYATSRQLRSVLIDWEESENLFVVISPYTSMAVAMANKRFETAGGREAGQIYRRTLRETYADFEIHFGVNVLRERPADLSSRLEIVTPAVKYMLMLYGLSGLVRQTLMQDSISEPVYAFNTTDLTDTLVDDAYGPGAVFNGEGTNGPLDFGPPQSPYLLNEQTLRGDLANAIASQFLLTEYNITLLDGDATGFYLKDLSDGNSPALFGGDSEDNEGPTVSPLPSLVWDERLDLISFAPDTGKPIHRRQAVSLDPDAAVDLATGFTGDSSETCPVVYKHTNQLASNTADDNPLRWRFAVSDRGFGVDPWALVARIGPRDSVGKHAEVAGTVVASTTGIDGGRGYIVEVLALRKDIPELASVEGIFDIEVQASDWERNKSPVLRGCWNHRPLAAPIQAGSIAYATGMNALENRRLENDNLGELIRGLPDPTPAAVVAGFDIDNPNEDPVYVSFRIDDLIGDYRFIWRVGHRAIEQDETPSRCLSNGFCSLERPRLPTDLVQPAAPLRAEAIAVHVTDRNDGTNAACLDCDDGEFLLQPGGHYRVELSMRDLGFLVPNQDSSPGELVVDQRLVQEFSANPAGEAPMLTGVDEGEYLHCAAPGSEEGDCLVHERFLLFHALREARLDIASVALHTEVRAHRQHTLILPAHPYGNPVTTLSVPREFRFLWSTRESLIP